MRAALPVLSHLRNSVEDGGNEGSSHFDVSPQFFCLRCDISTACGTYLLFRKKNTYQHSAPLVVVIDSPLVEMNSGTFIHSDLR